MDLAPSDTQREYRDRASGFAATELLPGYRQRETAGRIEPDLRREMGRLGLIAPQLPADLGGGGTDRLTTGLVVEEIGRGDINVGYLVVVGALTGQILAANAVPELARHWVPRICSGEEIVGIGLTEPHAGSDAGVPRLRATRDGSCDGADWVLDGVKSLSFAADASAVVVFARTGGSTERGRGIVPVPWSAADVFDRAARTPQVGQPSRWEPVASQLRSAAWRLVTVRAITGHSGDSGVGQLVLALASLVAEIAAFREQERCLAQAGAARRSAHLLRESRSAARPAGGAGTHPPRTARGAGYRQHRAGPTPPARRIPAQGPDGPDDQSSPRGRTR